ncbi:MAG: SDR family NAD(P)-dependent oxidoreductase [Pseudomonadota bacterium]
MKDFKDKVAVITGAASGIGFGIAERCAQEGMNVVLADVEEKALTKAEEEIKKIGAKALSVLTDVSKENDVKALAQKTLDTFGAVHVLCNNAGVNAGRTIWESTLADWEWVIGVNLWGVIYGVRTFLPIMLEQDTECHIVNTASMAGLISYPGSGVYNVTKQGIVALSETLYHELNLRNAKVKVSVLCPGAVNTQIIDAARNRPITLQNEPAKEAVSPKLKKQREAWIQSLKEGMSPQQLADHIFQSIRDEKFYILSHPEWKPKIQLRMEDILQGRNPSGLLLE